MTLLEHLIEKQNELRLSDRAFAKMLGISHGLWSETKRGTYPVQYKVLRGAAKQFPTLADAIVHHLTRVA